MYCSTRSDRYALAKIAQRETYLIYSEVAPRLGGPVGCLRVLPSPVVGPRNGVVSAGGWVTGGGQQTLTSPNGDQEMRAAHWAPGRPSASPEGTAPNPRRAGEMSESLSLSWTAGDACSHSQRLLRLTPAPTFQLANRHEF